jgi:hypothetical protein
LILRSCALMTLSSGVLGSELASEARPDTWAFQRLLADLGFDLRRDPHQMPAHPVDQLRAPMRSGCFVITAIARIASRLVLPSETRRSM